MIVYKSFGNFADGRAQYEKWLLQRPEFRADLLYDLAREERMNAELEDPSDGQQPW
jgi:hypothetical protein